MRRRMVVEYSVLRIGDVMEDGKRVEGCDFGGTCGK
jgi:hypothetical protein